MCKIAIEDYRIDPRLNNYLYELAPLDANKTIPLHELTA